MAVGFLTMKTMHGKDVQPGTLTVIQNSFVAQLRSARTCKTHANRQHGFDIHYDYVT